VSVDKKGLVVGKESIYVETKIVLDTREHRS